MRLFKKTNIDFMGKRKLWYSLSGLTLFIGLLAILFKPVNYSIDFVSGTELLIRFQTPPSINEVRTTMDRIGLPGTEIKTFGAPTDILIRTSAQEEGTTVADRIRSGLSAQFQGNNFEVLKKEKIEPKIGAELRRNAVYAVVATLVIILVYIGFRFKFIYGVAAVIALFHDVLLTLGLVILFNGVSPHLNLEISQNLMAAFLTLIGFSTSDTVIVFDRIRENLKIYRSESLFTVMNKSINETLSRTVITSGTVIMVLVVLIIFGGEVNRGFAFTFLIGTITGTYSSIYVASAIVLDYTRYKNLKAHQV
ncbi:MAG TPA: protein translocase subunit SecF [Bacteroidota bacterium]|nr:protein translocase subunit SecF [Bacteroidota bacterium]